MSIPWTSDKILEMARSFQGSCVLIAAAELGIFTILKARSLEAAEVAERASADPRAVTIILDALAALGLLEKKGLSYGLAAGVGDALVEGSPKSALDMVLHLGNCLRRWAELARTAKGGAPVQCPPSIRGAAADQAAFIGAMDEISRSVAGDLVERLGPRRFHHILDVGGASGTWTIAFLRAAPGSRATIFDLPEVVPLARKRLSDAGVADRVTFVPGDFYRNELPGGADLVWLSAIVHQNSREQNRDLFAKAHRALAEGGCIAIRDILMEGDRTRPVVGALFAVNMLAATEGGGTFTFGELEEDLLAAGFADASLIRKGEAMDSLVTARKGERSLRKTTASSVAATGE